MFLRLLVASFVWLVISGISLHVAWQQGNQSVGWSAQWTTRRALTDMSAAINGYEKLYQAHPTELAQLATMTNVVPGIVLWSENGFTDGWRHPFVLTNMGTDYIVISYGRDGKPGGQGIDFDLTSRNPHAPESTPTFEQFWHNDEMSGVIHCSVVCGGLAAGLSLLTIRIPKLDWRSLVRVLASLFITLVGALIATTIITALHIPSGH